MDKLKCYYCSIEYVGRKRTYCKRNFCSLKCSYKQQAIERKGIMPKSPPPILRREQKPNWKGGITHNKDGYIIELSEGKQKYQHRLVMERYLGRKLEYFELVHHINENKADNRIENLELTTRSAHIIHHGIAGHIPTKIRDRAPNGRFK